MYDFRATKVHFIIILVFFSTSPILGQSSGVLEDDAKASIWELVIANPSQKKLGTKKISLDSIKIKAVIYEFSTFSTHKFSSSDTKLNVEYYYDNSELLAIYITERSPLYRNNERLMCHTRFYLKNDSIYSEYIGYTKPNIWKDRVTPVDYDYKTKFKYNKSLTTDFLKKYTLDIWNKINSGN